MRTSVTPLYAVMIKTRYARYLPEVWITDTTETDANKAYQRGREINPLGIGWTVVEYHSQEWERLVR